MFMRKRIFMSTIEAIRKHVLRVSQAELAEIAGTSQATVSRWEKGELHPDIQQLQKIRSEAGERGIDWNDAWLFTAPPEPIQESA